MTDVPPEAFVLDDEHPWPGLPSFREEDSHYFRGRSEAIGIVADLVQRETLTVLFAPSGLGKTSLLSAGVFPLLRAAQFLPVYVRLDYAPSSPPLVRQVLDRLDAAARQSDVRIPAQLWPTLWEAVHRSGWEFWDSRHRLITPVLVFDQFEEVFTKGSGRADDVAALIVQLADLVERRIPADVRRRLETGEEKPGAFDFDRSGVRVVLSLREDFLPHLESLRPQLRGILDKRYRLEPMNGLEAMEVMDAGRHLLAGDAAERIVRFVAGSPHEERAPLRNLSIEPALLSVVARELNEKRRARGASEITTAHLSLSQREILADFYERSVADLDRRVRRFIEEELLTREGHRDSVALERVQDSLAAIQTLVNRRVLRIASVGRVERVELTHDLLTDVVRQSRDARRRKEAVYGRGLRIALAAIPLAVLVYLIAYLGIDYARPYSIEDHFKYGSTGGEHNLGLPYRLWRVLPVVFIKYLPDNGGKGYEAFGLIREEGGDLPIGVMKRRSFGTDRVFINCAACHSGTVRLQPNEAPRFYPAMPSPTFDFDALERFLLRCAEDELFRTDVLLSAMEQQDGRLGVIDRYFVYPLAIEKVRDRLLATRDRLRVTGESGPGRFDSANAAKALLKFPFDRLPGHELHGASDFPAVWNQRSRRGVHRNWDGNNPDGGETIRREALNTGAEGSTLDHAAIRRVENWLLDLPRPPYPYPINPALAARGKTWYTQYCAVCHAQGGSRFGRVEPIERMGTDPGRMNAFTYELAVNLSTLNTGLPYRFRQFRKTYGYVNVPLDGIWLRAPYLHNGSVPTLRDLLRPPSWRPRRFYRGNDLFDPVNVGFVSNVAQSDGRRYFLYDTSLPGNDNGGHHYGTMLPESALDALLEYLKTL